MQSFFLSCFIKFDLMSEKEKCNREKLNEYQHQEVQNLIKPVRIFYDTFEQSQI